MEKYIAYRDKDLEGDVWCEKVFLFKTEEDVAKFFTADNPKLLEVYTDNDSRELSNFEVHTTDSGLIISVTFETKYAGNVRLAEMSAGYLV